VNPQARAKPQKGCLYLYDAIGEDGMGGGISALQVVDALKELRAAGHKELEVRVSSPGGSVFDGLAMFRAISEWDGPKTAYVDGMACSAASFVILAADRVLAGAEAVLMVHEAWAGIFAAGTADEIVAAAESIAAPLRKANDSIVAIYTQRTGMDEKKCRALMTAETWMTGAEAKANGFVSEVLQDERATVGTVSDAAAAIISKFKNAPPSVSAQGRSGAGARMEARLLFDRVARATAAKGAVPARPGSVVTNRSERNDAT
jgi:ATP-dependent protease ClpP protease subunit